jgi:hypothetical protein
MSAEPQAPARVKVIASVTLTGPSGVLLAKYRNFPDGQQGWFVPHDIVPDRGDPDAVAASVLERGLGVKGARPVIDHVESFTGNDRSWHLCLHYRAAIPPGQDISPSGDIAAHEWFPPDRLPPREAVAHHGWALDIINRVLSRAPLAGDHLLK